MKISHWLTAVVAVAPLFSTLKAEEQLLGLKLPTYNDHIFGSEPQKFYMYTTRHFEGVDSKPWTAGQYGYVRNLRRTPEGVIGTRFHEGVDIRPMKRDAAGRPLDLVRSIAKGKVVYVNSVAGNSNYGKYVIVEHVWGPRLGAFYSLYAHLDEADCEVGQPVDAGTIIAKMGYTGAGINRERAHLHLELNVMAQSDFSNWFAHYFGSNNIHGEHNGLNMNGLNIAELFIRHRRDPSLKLSDFINKIPVYFKITIPREGSVALDIAKRYPWIRKGDHSKATPSWEISYASSGFPLGVTPSLRKVSKPVVSYVKPTQSDHRYHTKGLLSGTGRSASLTSIGIRTVALLSGDFPVPKAVVEPETPVTARPTR
ncbi:MAG: murein hydrolase activator EnvC family protein [Akkermansiaceae bacterium]